jgi:PAS domain S-box-containing protein
MTPMGPAAMTERTRIEALLQSEARLQAAVDLLGLGLYAWDPQTNALQWDARMKAMWGLPADAHIDYVVWQERLHPEDLPRVESAIAQCADPNGNGVYEIEYRVIGADGVERWVATRGLTAFDNGRPVRFLGVALDVTKQKRAEERLRHSEAWLSGILQQLPLGVSRSGRPVYVSRWRAWVFVGRRHAISG